MFNRADRWANPVMGMKNGLAERSFPPRASASRGGRSSSTRLYLEALESRVLFSTFTVADSGNATTNGTALANVLTGKTKDDSGSHFLQLGDTIILTAGATYYRASSFNLPYLTGTGVVTIESSAIASLPLGQRVGPSQSSLMPKLVSNSGTSIIETIMKDINGNAVTTPPHDYSLLGLEILPSTGTKAFTAPFLALGDGTSAQNSTSLVPYNFIVDRCYIHGYDDLTNADLTTDYKCGIDLNCLNATVENSYISDIHNTGADSQAIGGWNGMGNFTITNNFLEATGENFLMGGADSHLGVGVDPANITLTHNYFFKRLVWDPADPSFLGVNEDVKNIFELKHATYVLFDQNVLQNCWIGSDQHGEAVIVRPIDTAGGNTWALIHDVTMTNNIIENVGDGIQVVANYSGAAPSGAFYTSLPMYNVLVRNNLIETVSSGTANDGDGYGMMFGGSETGDNLTVDHNTVFTSTGFATVGSANPFYDSWTHFTYTNNVVEYGTFGFDGTAGQGTAALQAYMSGITMTNGGSGYTSAPTVIFSGGGGTGAAGTAVLANPIDGIVYNIKMTNNGSGYTSAPTITITGGGGSGATATAEIINGQVKGWIFSGNVIFGSTSGTTSYPAGNFFNSATATEDMIGLKDPAGELSGLLSSSPFFADGVDANGNPNGSTPGVNMAGLAGITDFVPIDNSVTGYWKFDDSTASTTVSDSSGNGHTGTLSSTTLWTTSGQSFDGLALTGGSSGSVSIPTFPTTTTFSFAAWIKPNTITANSYIANTGNSAFSLYVNSTGHLVATTSNGATVTDSTALTASTGWILVGITYDTSTGTLTLYKDGVVAGTNIHTGTIASGSTTLVLGNSAVGAANAFNGSIDEVRYYNSNMSTTDINGFSGMLRLYKMFGPLIANITPQFGGMGETTTTTKLTSSGSDHAAPYTGSNLPPASLTFSWSVASGPSGVTFSDNNDSTANTTTATWASAGVYLLKLVVSDAVGGSSVAYHKVYVDQYPTPVPTISPLNTSVGTNGTVQYTQSNPTVDQFGNPLLGSWIWAVASGGAGGSINASTGLYTAPATVGTDTVQLEYDDVNTAPFVIASTSVTVTGIPNAPSNLVATPGTSSIALAWTDNSTNETGFHIWRSTDNSTWGSAYATLGANVTTYTDSAPTAGTAYYYKVTAYNSGGDSSAAGMSCFVATVIAYDGFNYTVSSDGTTWNGHNTGIGFATGATWSLVSTTKASVVSGSLAPIPVNGHTLTTSANSVTLGNNQVASQTLATSVGTPGTTLWVSFEAAVNSIANAVLQIGTTASNNYIKFGIGANSGQVIAENEVINGVSNGKSTGFTASVNTTYFMVCSIQFLTTGDTVTMWVDPQPDKTTSPTNSIATATETLTSHMPVTSTISLTTGQIGSAIASFDEIRLGTTYASVAPDPLIATNKADPRRIQSALPIVGQTLYVPDSREVTTVAGRSDSLLDVFRAASPRWINATDIDFTLPISAGDRHSYDDADDSAANPADIFTVDGDDSVLFDFTPGERNGISGS